MSLYRSGIPEMDRAIDLQDAYWTGDPDTQQALLARPRHELTWAELLRLHHLSLLIISRTDHPLHSAAEMPRMRNVPHSIAHKPPQEQRPEQRPDQQRTAQNQCTLRFRFHKNSFVATSSRRQDKAVVFRRR